MGAEVSEQLLEVIRQAVRAEVRQAMAEVLARLDDFDPLHGEALLEQVLQHLLQFGLPLEFSIPELRADGVVTEEQAHRLTFAIRALIHKRGGKVGGLEIRHACKVRNVWRYKLDRAR